MPLSTFTWSPSAPAGAEDVNSDDTLQDFNVHPSLNTSHVLAVAERGYWFGMLEERFGIPASTFDGYVLIRPSLKYLCIVPSGHQAPAAPEPGSVGMVFIRTALKYPKLTTAGAMAFGQVAIRNYVSVDRACATAYLARQPFPVSAEETRLCTGTGYVIVKHDEFVLGLGLLRQQMAGGLLESLYPKGWAHS